MFTKAVGTKFHEDGSLRYFPGNTVVSQCYGIEPLFSRLVWAQEQFKALAFADKFAFLPPESFHMTVFELLCDQVRSKEHWSTLIAQDAPLEAIDAALGEIFHSLDHPASITMKFEEIAFGLAITLALQPADEAMEQQLHHYRDTLARHTGIRFPNHDVYRFHIGLAYNLVQLTETERTALAATQAHVGKRLAETIPEFTIPGPVFVMFHDMGGFYEQLVRDK